MNNRLLTFVKRIPITFAIVATLFIFNYISFLTRTAIIRPSFTFYDIAAIFGSLLGVLLLWFICGTLFSIGARTYLVLFSVYVFFYHLFGTYRFRSKIPFDISVMMDNAGDAWNTESLSVILDSVSLHVFIIGLIPLFAVLFFPPMRHLVLRERDYGWRHYLAAILARPLYGWLALSPYGVYDDLGTVLHSVHDYV